MKKAILIIVLLAAKGYAGLNAVDPVQVDAQIAAGDYSNVCSTCAVMGVYGQNGEILAGGTGMPPAAHATPVQSEAPQN